MHITPSSASPQAKHIFCDHCGQEWLKQEVENDQTVHKMDSYRFKFLRTFRTLKTGFRELLALLACPICRHEVKTV